ncbi:MAG: MBOAT family protein [Candidatus Nanoarchaeia archaeon]|nr:MBOAT family protein [Candidatus Nanoarchaeia archaeon]
MLFVSPVFLFLFLPFILLINLILNKRYSNYFLLIASIFFYFWGEGAFTLIMLISIIMNHIFAKLIEKYPGKKALGIITLTLIFNLSLLIFFKYSSFLLDNFNTLLLFIKFKPIIISPIHLPIGISFFTFQAMSYVLDVYFKKTDSEKSIFNTGLFISLFPQLIAGPIVRYTDIKEEIKDRKLNFVLFSSGVERFIIGLSKKIMVADILGKVTDGVFLLNSSKLSPEVAWAGIICYTLQIYFDFSGYSDMAIGIGKMLGFKFLENFNYPYISKSIREFWKRWHISLSTWFRDYLYIPLGGNRISKIRTGLNLILVFFLCGLWHGAAWTFVIWGLFHGFFLIIERSFLGNLLKKIPSLFSRVYTILIVMISFVFFKSESLNYAINYLKAMLGLSKTIAPCSYLGLYFDNFTIFILIIGILASTPIFIRLKEIFTEKINTKLMGFFKIIFYITLFIITLGGIAVGSFNPFIYFRF